MHDLPNDSARAGMPDADGERSALLAREAALRTVGALWMLLGAALVLFGFGATGLALDAGYWHARGVALVTILLLLGTSGLFLGWGMAGLKPWVRRPLAVIALPLLVLAAPFFAFTGHGTWLALSAKGRRVLAHEHAALRARTPHLRARSRPGEALAVVGILLLNLWAVVCAIDHWDLPAV